MFYRFLVLYWIEHFKIGFSRRVSNDNELIVALGPVSNNKMIILSHVNDATAKRDSCIAEKSANRHGSGFLREATGGDKQDHRDHNFHPDLRCQRRLM